MKIRIRVLMYVVVIMLIALTGTLVQAQDATATPEDHAQHHPEATETPEPGSTDATAPETEAGMGMMQDMGGMMDMMNQMMGMEMSANMMPMMHQMMGMMNMMMPGMGMSAMSDLLDQMMGMEMSDDMMGMMQEMRGMMDMMMSGTSQETAEETTDGMDMDTGYSSNDLAPLAMAYYQGQMVYFIHPEASDAGVAQILTDMMGAEVLTVPGLAQIPAELLDNAYVFTNGVEGMGPLGFQPDVFDTIPSDEGYSPLRAISLVTWQEGATARELTGVEEILAAEAGGELVIEQPGVVVNMSILVWGDQTR